jgi:hypothetical protein
VRHGELVGVDWSKALRDPLAPLQRPQSIKTIRHFPSDLWNAIQKKQKDRIFYWVFNRNKSWASIPFYDCKFLLGAGRHLLSRMGKINCNN